VAIRFDYFRGGRQLSSIPALVCFFWAALPLSAQYPGQVAEKSHDAPELRSIAVLEWTGEAGKPKASRLVPVAVFDASRLEGDQLQDGSIYLARPEPLALTGEVEYELQQNGSPLGLYDIRNAGREQGVWVGYGAWKPLAAPKAKPSMDEVARSLKDDEDSDRPVLHRKKHADDASGGKSDKTDTTPSAPAADPDRPTLHKKDSGASSKDASDTSSNTTVPADDPDRPVLKKSKKKPEDVGHVDSVPEFTDPDRPVLKRGKSTASGLDIVPSLMGMPPEMQQTVAVSDLKSRPSHPWNFTWSNPDDEAKMKSALEEIARDALGLKPPPPAPKRTAARKSAKAALPAEPAPLLDEQFRVFELAYGSGATLLLTARTDGQPNQQKFVTLIAQPDLYGNVSVLLKSVTDSAHLDDTPRMRLIDAVDALADNRGELLFELRGRTQRQFALYRVLRGRAEQLFRTDSAGIGGGNNEQRTALP